MCMTPTPEPQEHTSMTVSRIPHPRFTFTPPVHIRYLKDIYLEFYLELRKENIINMKLIFYMFVYLQKAGY